MTRKTFVVGKLTLTSAHIRIVDAPGLRERPVLEVLGKTALPLAARREEPGEPATVH